MTIETATFLVQRAGTQFKCTGADLPTKLQEDDLMAVTRPGDDTYKWVVSLPPVPPFRIRIDTRLKNPGDTTAQTYKDITLNELGQWWTQKPTMDVDWGDGTIQTLTEADGLSVQHIYAVAGEYVIKTGISGYSLPACASQNRILEMKGNEEGTYILRTPGTSPLDFSQSFSLTEANSDTFDWTQVKNATRTYYNCQYLTIFEGADFAGSLTEAEAMFGQCKKLVTVGPITGTSNCTTFKNMFLACEELTAAPTFDTSSATDLSDMFKKCEKLAVAPTYDLSGNPDISNMFDSCKTITSPAIGCDFSNQTSDMFSVYYNCINLTYVPPNFIDGCPNPYPFMFQSCALTPESMENFLVSMDSCGLSNGATNLNGGSNASKSTWTTAANTAYDNCISRGYTIRYNT